jgi:hypothetical protein
VTRHNAGEDGCVYARRTETELSDVCTMDVGGIEQFIFLLLLRSFGAYDEDTSYRGLKHCLLTSARSFILSLVTMERWKFRF